jgi:hypothetical protein
MQTNQIRFRSILHISSQARVTKSQTTPSLMMVVRNNAHKLHGKISTKNTIQKRVYIDIDPKTPIPNRAAKSTPKHGNHQNHQNPSTATPRELFVYANPEMSQINLNVKAKDQRNQQWQGHCRA